MISASRFPRAMCRKGLDASGCNPRKTAHCTVSRFSQQQGAPRRQKLLMPASSGDLGSPGRATGGPSLHLQFSTLSSALPSPLLSRGRATSLLLSMARGSRSFLALPWRLQHSVRMWESNVVSESTCWDSDPSVQLRRGRNWGPERSNL